MKAGMAIGPLLLLVITACQLPEDESNLPGSAKPTKGNALEITPASSQFDQRRTKARAIGASRDSEILTEGDIVNLPKFVVTAEGFANFGFSVITNPEVRRGGMIEWMSVGVVIPDSIAARSGLFTGDQILAIDGVLVTDFNRDAMLSALFQRSATDRLRLAVLARRLGHLPVFVTLDARTPSAR